jgi:transcriptional regulator with XRE-family HTH domain
MGKARQRQDRLGEKLRHIRFTLDLSQAALHKTLGVEKEITYNRISDYELNKLDPPLIVLIEYARVAGVHLELIADDRLDLPKKLPGKVNYDAWNLPRPKQRK